jgi:F420-dependent oxidoreductase-like protein
MKALIAVALAVLVPVLATAGERPVEFGVQIAPENATYEDIVATWKLVEDLGYDSAWLNDHFMPLMGDKDQSHFEAWTMLAALATQTQRIRIGILVSGNTYREPAVLAKMATTVDHISHGRLNFGIGAGWAEFEHRAYGIPFYTARERAERLGEALAVITTLWGANHPTFDGKYYHLFQAPFAPKPVQQPHPPIVVGGQGKKWLMPLVARYADEWNVPVGVTPQGMRKRLEIIRAECQRLNRSPCVRRVSVFLPLINMTNLPVAETATRLAVRLRAGDKIARSVLAGSVDDIKARIQQFVDAGATSVIITTRPALNHELMRRFATEVMPAFRQAPPGSMP